MNMPLSNIFNFVISLEPCGSTGQILHSQHPHVMKYLKKAIVGHHNPSILELRGQPANLERINVVKVPGAWENYAHAIFMVFTAGNFVFCEAPTQKF
jgi:hypothetical protein